MRTDPRPTRDTIPIYYPDSYEPYHGSIADPTEQHKLAAATTRPRLLDFRTNTLPRLPTGRLLEVGCASGAFLDRMATQGWDVAGIEPSPAAAANAQGLGYSVQACSIEDASPPAQPYDLVTGFMVLEHLHEPLQSLERLHRWTRPGGWLVLSVPHARALEARIFGDAWYGLQLPTHLYHYTPSTLRLMLERAGWGVERVMHQRIMSNLFVSLGYKLHDAGFNGPVTRSLLEFPRLANSWPLHQALFPLAALLAAFGQTGRMTVWARKYD